MTRNKLLIAALIVVASNLVALGRAGLNRSGEPEATLVLTEREAWLSPVQAENTALTLRLRWTDLSAARPSAGPAWFDAGKLAAIGFDCRQPATEANAASYRGMPPRSVYAALEFEGAAWQRHASAPPPGYDPSMLERESRLVLVDVGRDARELRTRYPDRNHTVIVPAVAVLVFTHLPGQKPTVRGRVTQVYPLELNVPRASRSPLEKLVADRGRQPSSAVPPERWANVLPHEPRYRVTVKWGRSLEPWIVAVQPIPTQVLAK